MTLTEEILIGAGVSTATTVLSLAVVTFVLVRLPSSYFTDAAHRSMRARHPALRVMAIAAKNMVGLLLVIAGVIMALPMVPGSGILTAFLGVVLLDFPGKYRLERSLLWRPRVLQEINRLRARFGKPGLEVP